MMLNGGDDLSKAILHYYYQISRGFEVAGNGEKRIILAYQKYYISIVD